MDALHSVEPQGQHLCEMPEARVFLRPCPNAPFQSVLVIWVGGHLCFEPPF